MIDTIIFDLDGLMFDTESISIQAWKQMGKKYGVEVDDEFIYMITGGGPQQFAYACELYPEMKIIASSTKPLRRKLVFEKAHDGMLNKKGLILLLQYLEKHHYKKAVASSSDRAYVDTLLNSIGEHFSFDAIIGGDEVDNAKPAPDVFLKVAKKMQSDPSTCLVIEDSKMGSLAAKRANMQRMFIKDMVPIDDELEVIIQHQCESLLDVITFLDTQK